MWKVLLLIVEKRDLIFDINKYSNLKKRSTISYWTSDQMIYLIDQKDSFGKTNSNFILNALKEKLSKKLYIKGLDDADQDDLIIISDVMKFQFRRK